MFDNEKILISPTQQPFLILYCLRRNQLAYNKANSTSTSYIFWSANYRLQHLYQPWRNLHFPVNRTGIDLNLHTENITEEKDSLRLLKCLIEDNNGWQKARAGIKKVCKASEVKIINQKVIAVSLAINH